MRAALHYLYLWGGGLIALREEAGRLRPTGRFERPTGHGTDDPSSGTPPWADGFTQLLQAHRRDQYVLAVDTVDEELQLEQLPRMRGADLRRLAARRLEQRFRGRARRPGGPVPRRRAAVGARGCRRPATPCRCCWPRSVASS